MKTSVKLNKQGVYVNSTKSLDFNPETGVGHSYQWYCIAKKINSQQILNTYRYSKTTAAHVRCLRDLFNSLGINYIEQQAEKGL